jgi:hypothetical protein
MNATEAVAIAGTLSKPGKMPVHATSLPATACKVGARLVEVEGSTCSGCYALKGNYRFGNVQRALLRRIVEVCEKTPNVRHWVPTREYKVVGLYRKLYGEFPSNLVVRLSAHMVDSSPPSGYGLPTSTVTRNGGATCPAPTQGNKCLDCRACWEPTVVNVAYKYH